MNRQINPDHCYVTDDGVIYMLEPALGTPEWHVMKDGRRHQTFTSLMAAKGWLEHVLEQEADEQDEDRDERMDRGDWEFHRDHDQ